MTLEEAAKALLWKIGVNMLAGDEKKALQNCKDALKAYAEGKESG